MATTIKLKRSSTSGSAPGTGSLALGELALNTYDGKIYLKKSVSGTESIVAFSSNSIADSTSLVQILNNNVNVTANAGVTARNWIFRSDGKLQLPVAGDIVDSSNNSVLGGATNVNPVRTFNILNEFTAPLLGNAIYVPASPVTIQSVLLTNGQAVAGDLTVGLYRNGDFLAFYTIPSGDYTNTYTSQSLYLTPGDYITVSVVSGSGLNFNMQLFNVNLT